MRLIDADTLKELIAKNVYPLSDAWNSRDYGMFWTGGIEKAIDDAPTIAPKRGKWNWDFADNGWADWTCSICGWKKNTDIHVNLGYNYCPNCGAKMEEVTE